LIGFDILSDSLKGSSDTMSEYIVSDGFNIFGGDICPTFENRHNLGGFYERNRSAWRSSKINQTLAFFISKLFRFACCKNNVCDIFIDFLIYIYFFCNEISNGNNILTRKYLFNFLKFSRIHSFHNLYFLRTSWIIHIGFKKETIELCFRKRICPLLFDRILGGEDNKRNWK